MTSQQISLHDGAHRGLPPVLIDAHAFFTFGMRMHHSLKGLERRFGAESKPGVPPARKAWAPLPKKPR